MSHDERTFQVSLIEWPDGPDCGGPRLLGSTTDPELVELVREELADQRVRQLRRLENTELALVEQVEKRDAD